MRNSPLFVTCLCISLASGTLQGAPATELDTLKAGYAAEKVRIDGAYAAQKTNAFAAYRLLIDSQMLAVKRKGDLDSYLMLEAEKKRFSAEGKVKTNDNAEAVGALVAQLQKMLQDADAARDKAKMALLKQYVGRLSTLMQNYTRTDRLADARTVRDELQVAKTDLVFQEEDTPPETPKTNDPVGKPPPAGDAPAKQVVGTWDNTWRSGGRSGTDKIFIKADGTATCGGDTGRWEMKDRQCVIHWPRTDNTFTLAADGKRMTGHTKTAISLTAVKVGP